MNHMYALAIMILVTYLPRAVPLILFRRTITNKKLRYFLGYVPYAVLTAMTIPAIFYATRHPLSAALGLVTAFVLSKKGSPLMLVALGAAAMVFVAELVLGLPFA